MSAVRDFPKIKAIRSFVIGGVGSGMLPPASPSSHASPSRHLTRITQAVTTTMSKAATGKRTNLLLTLHMLEPPVTHDTRTRIHTLTRPSPQAHRLSHLYPLLQMGEIPWLPHLVGHQRPGLLPRRDRGDRRHRRLRDGLRRPTRLLACPPALRALPHRR